MEITFLLGNGLDLNCGCKSAYGDIFNYYISQPSKNKWIKQLKEEILTWGDFEMEMASYIGKCESEEAAIDCIRDFKRQMDRYLQSENDRMTDEIYEKKGKGHIKPGVFNEIQKSITDFYLNCTPNVSYEIKRMTDFNFIHYNFISFNYTTFLDSLICKAAKKASDDISKSISQNTHWQDPEIIHIHGTLNGNELVGIDNKNQFGEIKYSHEALDGIFIKPILNQTVDLQRILNASDAIKSASIICVFGMSLGDSDLTWRTMLFDWLQADESHHLFVYDYSQCNSKNYLIDEKVNAEERARKHFLTRCNVDIHGIEKQIHIPIGANIFNIGSEIEKNKHSKKTHQ